MGNRRMVTRRKFIGQVAAAGAGIAALSLAPGAAVFAEAANVASVRKPIVSFHMDRPYVDWTGTAEPYYPPVGARSAEAASRLSEEAFRRMQCYA
ncbi:MAG TPA: twin-arginine translocation signal domain-containing protein [Candidatus Baltobacteraceae bacterium]|nr:twin-arginine translocation signal domain-containing protein [Candidatus Baltobacteraceae bacterium]